ncbi:MAG: hypothetical protein BWY77_00752 [bacterium ADurb.Bin431]|nr:MAG: hypothetical protein BWY77_00752 [bacterium ADurb.Bin431]
MEHIGFFDNQTALRLRGQGCNSGIGDSNSLVELILLLIAIKKIEIVLAGLFSRQVCQFVSEELFSLDGIALLQIEAEEQIQGFTVAAGRGVLFKQKAGGIGFAGREEEAGSGVITLSADLLWIHTGDIGESLVPACGAQAVHIAQTGGARLDDQAVHLHRLFTQIEIGRILAGEQEKGHEGEQRSNFFIHCHLPWLCRIFIQHPVHLTVPSPPRPRRGSRECSGHRRQSNGCRSCSRHSH